MVASWIERAAGYRLGRITDPDLHLAEAASHAGTKEMVGVLLFNEAAIAWRSSKARIARALAIRCRDALAAIAEGPCALTCACLLVHLGEAAAPGEVAALGRRAAREHRPGVGIQALALLEMSSQLGGEKPSREVIATLAATVPRRHWKKRMDILSVEEALAALPDLALADR
jgi:hypothetical protein